MWRVLWAFSSYLFLSSVFFFNDTATTEIYTLSLHDALPIYGHGHRLRLGHGHRRTIRRRRSEEHSSELQSRRDLVCRLLLEKKKTRKIVSHQRCTNLARTGRTRNTRE